MADGDRALDEALHGKIEERELEKEMRSSYLDYAMSVIVGRALPDVRDGLKPVHRRVLYAMHDLGLQPNRSYRKCAFIVGEVMGKYHPHGDSAIYETLVRMAQDFSLRYPLVDGQGNFGSIDDDPPAAMRYTEARLGPLATEMLRDIEADTVDFGPNYDEKTREPLLLPARFPNLLVNGAAGIAVGMATNIPPHNLREVIGAVQAYIDDPEIDMRGLMKHIKGPDFPGGGTIMGTQGIRDAYRSGRGSIRVRAKVHVEPLKGGREALIVTELPFQVKKGGEGGLITKIADLVREKKVTGISDLRDESDRNGMRLVIELKRGAEPAQVVLNQLYKRTAMQQAFGINMVALVDGVPRTLSLRELVEHYVGHQKEIVTRRTQHQLARAEARAHILEGLLVALKNLNAVIRLIRASKDPDAAREGLIDKFNLTRPQAQAILDMRLQRLTALEADKIKTEHRELTKLIKELRAILADEKKVLGLVKTELAEIADRYGDDRRTEITAAEGELEIEDVIADQQMVVSITASGYAKRTPLTTYRQQRRGGRGVMGMNLKEKDYIEHLHVVSTLDYLLFFTNQGKVYRLKVYELPEGNRAARGRALINVLPLKDKERVMAVIPTRDFSEGKFLIFGTAQGMVKKTPFKDYDTPIRADGIIAIKVRKGDELVRVRMTSGRDDIILVSKSGHATRFNEKQARPMGRGTAGVKGMNVADKGNEVLSLDVVSTQDKKGELLVVTENGYGKRTRLTEYPVKGRGAKGVLTAKLTAKKGGLAGGRVVREGQELLFISQSGMVQRTAVSEISTMGRPTQGVRLMNLKKGDRVSAVALVMESEGNGNGATATTPTVEDEAPTATSVADEAAAAEAAGNGEATVTRSDEATVTKAKTSRAKAKPSRSTAKSAPTKRKAASKTKAKPVASPAKKRAASSRKPSRPKVKPKHTATAKQRAESAAKKKR
jgi:DNA gyrase subunit A